MREVAERAGVSRSAVSLALQQHPSIPVATRERIHAAAAELGYRKNPLVAALMRSRRSQTTATPVRANLAYLTADVPNDAWRDAATLRSFHTSSAARADQRGFRLDEFSLTGPRMNPQRLAGLLKARGIKVAGDPIARHRPVMMSDDPVNRAGATPAAAPAPWGTELARLEPPPLAGDIAFTLKQSQNLHAELMLRRLGATTGTGSAADGVAVIDQMLLSTGAARTGWDFSDGSGMSTYNRVSPRLVTRFLVWTTHQPWGDTFRTALPVGGVDGTLSRRFAGTPLEGKIFAKTGSLSAVNALAGFMVAKSGRTLAFAAYVNDLPSQTGSAIPALDELLLQVAAKN
jgi:D-alanyl-D-alanine carboxypeptidase